MKSTLFRLFALLVVISMIVAPVSAQSNTQGDTPQRPTPPMRTGDFQPAEFSPKSSTFGEFKQELVLNEIEGANEPAPYIVLFEGKSLVALHGGAAGLNVKSIQSQSYLNTLAEQRSTTLAQAEKTLGRSLKVIHVYDVVLNGVAVNLTPDEAEVLASQPGIREVLRDTIEQPTTDAGPIWIGAEDLWNGASVPDGIGTQGEGILVGIIDTGINFDHPSFSDTPDDGYVYEWTGDYLGVCAPTGGDPLYATACNDKLVGAYSYTWDSGNEVVSPEDGEGHGSHTASTTAGNTVDVDFFGTPLTISGVAPHAQIISYDVCYPNEANGACEGNDSVAAIQQAILDGVDVLNYSISGGEDPYNDLVELTFLEAFNAGITVATSAGNSGPTAETVAHRSPWLLSTAATTHNRKFTSEVNFSDPLYQGILTLAGEIPFTTAVAAADVKFAGEAGNPLGCAIPGYPANFYDGAIALIKRGTCTFSEKINTAEAAGASGVLVFTDDRAPGAMSVIGTNIPGVMLDIPGTSGDALAAWITAQTTETVDITAFGALYSGEFGDIMGDFSSRGPNTTFDVLKPDLGAPGVEILAAVSDSTIVPSVDYEINLLQGTSMASPHDAGSAALLMALHPDWTPAEIKSALMLTAYGALLKEDKVTPVDPFDIGSGRIALEMAGLTGLVMDETYDNFVAADPDLSGDVKTLNIPSLYNSQCVGECSWTRTFTSVATVPATYTVEAPDWITVTPTAFTINPSAKQVITITADVSATDPGEWVFANIYFNTDTLMPNPFHTLFLPVIMNGIGSQNLTGTKLGIQGWGDLPISDVHIPAAIMPTASNLPAMVQFETHRDAGGGTISDLLAVEITALTVDTYGFVKGVPTAISLAEDPTNGDAYDNLSQVYYTIIPMDAGAARVVAEITASTAPDVDMFWGFDYNGDGLPQESEQYEASATGTAFEYLSEWGFPVGYYDVWVLVQNWAGSAAPADDITLMLGVVPYEPADPATMTVNGPATNGAGVPFSLDILWHDIDTEEGDRLYGMMDVYADATYDVGIGLTEIDVVRGADDVVKTADVETASPGDVITYTIEITNFTTEAIEYAINDVLPAGVTYVPDSATGGALYDNVANAITWTGPVDASYRDYVAATSAEDPYCSLAIMDDGDSTDAYLDWKTTEYGFSTDYRISGNSFWYGTFSTYEPFNFYGTDYVGMEFTADGYAGFDMAAVSNVNQDLPDAANPNNVLSMFWDDFTVVYDAATNKGVSTIGDGESFATIEYDDVTLNADPTKSMDMEIGYFLQPDDAPGAYEIIYAYDNITPGLFAAASGTIGVENAAGTAGTLFSYNDTALTIADGSAICFDWALLPSPPKVITFQVTVDNDAVDGELLNIALHDTDLLGAEEETAEASVDLNVFSVTNLDLRQSTDPFAAKPWTIVPGDYVGGFTLALNTTVPYYYLDTDTITANYALANGYHQFFVDTTPAGFFTYWDAKGVNAGADPLTWQGVMWKIIHGDEPIFMLKVTGTDYMLVDGFTFAMGGGDTPLRINGDYLVGAYTFTGDVTDAFGYNADTLNVGITFTAP